MNDIKINKDNFPSLPGVYLFKNRDSEIIYVGKAKILKKRIQSYFLNKEKDWKIKSLIDEHDYIDYIVTKTEPEALLLEAQLIKDNQPKFNVLLKSGQPFVYLLFTKAPAPKLELVRNKSKKGTYFGPFLHKKQARSVYDYLLRTFRLEWCTSKIKEGCLKYHIDLCVGNCREDFNKDDYLFRIDLTINILKNNYSKSLNQLKERIKEHNKGLEFEKAKNLSEYLHNLDTIFATLKTKFSEKRYENDVFLATSPIHTRKLPDIALAKKLQDFIQSSKPIITIDCFDISHFQSNFIVGSCIRFSHGIPDKNNFRRFKIKTLTQQNDYAALQEIVSRRYKNETDLPDLIVIDGGKGQLNAIKQIINTTHVISLAKKEERLFIDRFPHGILLDINTELGKLFIALRDYAHHFAISYHRVRRKKELEGQQ
ncbi:MAG: GIY-YIG nuclease family protein [Candidatus Babeliales bacterium]